MEEVEQLSPSDRADLTERLVETLAHEVSPIEVA